LGVPPQTQGKIFWNHEFEIINNNDSGGRGGERAVDGDNSAKGDRGWRAANEDRWLVNADYKGVDDMPQSKIGRQRVKSDKKPNFKRADNDPRLTRAKT
jgi:hypothetical protein